MTVFNFFFFGFNIKRYIPKIRKYVKKLSRKCIRDFIFHNFDYLPSATKKYFYQTLSKYSTTTLKNDEV